MLEPYGAPQLLCPPLGECKGLWPLLCLQISRRKCNRAFYSLGGEFSDGKLGLSVPLLELYMMDPDMNDSDVSTGNVDISRSVSDPQ